MKSLYAVILGASFLPTWAPAKEPPVTRTEAAAVFAKAQKIIKSVLKLKSEMAVFPAGPGLASRSQILQHFDRIRRAVEPQFRFTPPREKPAAAFISFKDPASKRLAEQLEVMGFLDRYGALATAKTDGLEPRQFGDALGFFVSRIAELTHTPSSKFSPYLMPG
jgi:hypothetical protein